MKVTKKLLYLVLILLTPITTYSNEFSNRKPQKQPNFNEIITFYLDGTIQANKEKTALDITNETLQNMIGNDKNKKKVFVEALATTGKALLSLVEQKKEKKITLDRFITLLEELHNINYIKDEDFTDTATALTEDIIEKRFTEEKQPDFPSLVESLEPIEQMDPKGFEKTVTVALEKTTQGSGLTPLLRAELAKSIAHFNNTADAAQKKTFIDHASQAFNKVTNWFKSFTKDGKALKEQKEMVKKILQNSDKDRIEKVYDYIQERISAKDYKSVMELLNSDELRLSMESTKSILRAILDTAVNGADNGRIKRQKTVMEKVLSAAKGKEFETIRKRLKALYPDIIEQHFLQLQEDLPEKEQAEALAETLKIIEQEPDGSYSIEAQETVEHLLKKFITDGDLNERLTQLTEAFNATVLTGQDKKMKALINKTLRKIMEKRQQVAQETTAEMTSGSQELQHTEQQQEFELEWDPTDISVQPKPAKEPTSILKQEAPEQKQQQEETQRKQDKQQQEKEQEERVRRRQEKADRKAKEEAVQKAEEARLVLVRERAEREPKLITASK